jgi:hypothetical protein
MNFNQYLYSIYISFTNFIWTIFGGITDVTFSKEVISKSNSFEIESLDIEEEEKKQDDEHNDLLDEVNLEVKQMYFNRDEILNFFNKSREEFAKSLTLQDKVYFFKKLSNFQIRKMDKIIKEELDNLFEKETDEIFLSILKDVDWEISKEYYTKHFYNCKLLYYKLISAKPLFLKIMYDYNYTYKGKLRNVYTDTLNFLFSRAKDENESINIRAECLDTILTYGRLKEQEEADVIIKQLGQMYIENKDKTIYTNSQNVHSDGVQKTSARSLLNLATYHRPCDNLDKIYEMILNKLVDQEEKREKVIKALKRIMMDPTLFQGFNISQILSIVWQEIERLTKHKSSLEERLIEELYDADETCSSGYFTRLINVLSGFSIHVKIGISIEEEIIARVTQYIKNRTNKLDNLEKERLSLEIMDEDNDPSSFRIKLREETRVDVWKNVIEENKYNEKLKEDHLKEMINIKLNYFFGK